MDYCACDGGETLDLQLFASQLFPASTNVPETAITFQVLEQFRLLNLEGKTSAHSYVKMLLRLTSGDELGTIPTVVGHISLGSL